MTESAQIRSDTERSFLQERVALLGLVLSVLGVLGFLGSLSGPDVANEIPWFVASGLSTGVWVALWLLCRGRPRSPGLLRTAEAASFVCTGVFMSIMCRLLTPSSVLAGLDPLGWGVEPGGHFWGLTRLYWALAHIYGLAMYCMLRAALVPSPPWRTLLLTSVVGIPLVVVVGTASLPVDSPDLSGVIPSDYAAVGIVNVSMQWLFTVAICTVMSKVIFGLRRELQAARRLGQYTLGAKIGAGGMGTVYRATHAMMRRPTAIKLLSQTSTSRDGHARFEREVQQTARLTHPNTITIFDYGRTPDGLLYYVMELLDGATLESVVDQSGPMSPGRVVHVLNAICGSLAEAHGVGLIHRDVKPANIVLCTQGGRPDVPKLLDFGLVKDVSDSADAGLTGAAAVAGTPLYMAPEMLTHPEDVDARADTYAVGAVAYFMLTGTHVFEGATVVEVCSHHLHSEPQAPSARLGSALPGPLEALVLRCLSKKPDDRPESVSALAEQLADCGDIPPWTVHDARAWWHDNGDVLANKPEPVESGDRSRTLAVDLNR